MQFYNTNGTAKAITDNEMLEAQYMLAKEEGIFTEATGGAVFAGLMKLVKEGKLKGKRVVCVLCGDGLKDPASVLKVAIKPPTINPRVGDFLSFYNNSFFEGKTVSFVDREMVVFSKEPTKEELSKYLEESFSVKYTKEYIEKIFMIIKQFLAKGKEITFSDIQDIIQDSLESVKKEKASVITVKDFQVQTAKDKKANAMVIVDHKDQVLSGNAEGTGPVDAVINALKNACSSQLDFSLTEYKVNIRSQGADAVVYVDLKLIRNGTTSLGRGASPDIIQASISAFEEAYNGLW